VLSSGVTALPTLQSELDAGNDGCFSAFRAAATHLDEPFTIITVENLVQAGQLEHPNNLPAALLVPECQYTGRSRSRPSLVVAHRAI
jgi:hypothetical protein